MPEALTTIPPPLKLAVENPSETDGVGTDRSGTSTHFSSGSARNHQSHVNERRTNAESVAKRKYQPADRTAPNNGPNKKSRRSIGRRGSKKAPLKLGTSPQKYAAAQCLKSQIPRALLLTPSSSSASLNTNASATNSSDSLEVPAICSSSSSDTTASAAAAAAPANVVVRKVHEAADKVKVKVEIDAETETETETKPVAQAETSIIAVEPEAENEITKESRVAVKCATERTQRKVGPQPSAAVNNNKALAPLTPRPAQRKCQFQIELQRKYTNPAEAAILQFRLRKSISQMEFKRNRRAPSPYASLKGPQINAMKDIKGNASALVPNSSNNIATIMNESSQSSLVNKIFDRDNYYYVIQDRDPKVAGMRIFATIMLNAWRKRRDEVKRLMEEVNDLKRGSIKAKNQLHVFNTLFRVEQKRNDELSCQLKRSLEDINNTKTSCESLTTSLISLKADKALLEQQIQIKEQEFDGLNAILTQTKSDLFKAMAQQRELQANLSSEQRKVQSLETQKNELINEICEVNNESLQKEENLRSEMLEKELALQQAIQRIDELEAQINNLKDKTCILDNCLDNEARLKQEIDALHNSVATLQQCLAATLGHRLKTCWSNSLSYQKATLQLLHWVAFCTLPATPPPKITNFPFGLTLEKALSIVKR